MAARYALLRSLSHYRVALTSSNKNQRYLQHHIRKFNSDVNTPWFITEPSANDGVDSGTLNLVDPASHSSQALPEGLPEHLLTLHNHLSHSPLLAQSTLRICRPSSLKPQHSVDDLALAYSRPKGRRGRGIHYAGETLGEPDDMWAWYVLAQVKEGTEGRGAIEAVIRSAQKELLKYHPHLPIPKKLSRRRTSDGWEVLDIGDSLLHVVSQEAARKWFT